MRNECKGGKYSLVLNDVVFEIKSIVHPGNNEYTGKELCFVSGEKYRSSESA